MDTNLDPGADSNANTEMVKRFMDRLPPFNQLGSLVTKLKATNQLRFDVVFHDPAGNYLIKCFLASEYALSKANFFSDVEVYRQMSDEGARLGAARMIVDEFVKPSRAPIQQKTVKHSSVFGDRVNTSVNVCSLASSSLGPPGEKRKGSIRRQDPSSVLVHEPGSMLCPATNPVGVYGQVVVDVISKVQRGDADPTLFDTIVSTVLNDLEFDSFPRFLQSPFFERYIRTKSYQINDVVTIRQFQMMQVLGQGVSSTVRSVLKKDMGVIYAARVFNKRWVQETHSLKKILRERDLLASVCSPFVVGLKYAIQDTDNLYLILDLMTGGHMKCHLEEEPFTESHARFHAAEILLGLEQIHEHDIILRDLNLESVLLDAQGHCKISDFGLAVKTTTPITGYAGTPGHIAPEILKGDPYTKSVDFFSYGVMIYKMICGFSAFDKCDLEHVPFFPSEIFSPEASSLLKSLLEKDPAKRLGSQSIDQIKLHSWFNPIDWGLLEAGYISAPHLPVIHSEKQLKGTRFPAEENKYRDTNLTEEFIASLSSFDYKSPTVISCELAQAMIRADHGIDFEMFSKPQRSSTPKKKPSSCNVM